MTNIHNFLTQALGLTIKQEGSQYVADCPDCGKARHFYIDAATGKFYCQACQYKGNLYVLARKILGCGQAAAMQLLSQYDLAASRSTPAAPKLRELTEKEITQFCEVKQIDREAFMKFEPKYYERSGQSCVVIPGYG